MEADLYGQAGSTHPGDFPEIDFSACRRALAAVRQGRRDFWGDSGDLDPAAKEPLEFIPQQFVDRKKA